jgi:hypothetical protein
MPFVRLACRRLTGARETWYMTRGTLEGRHCLVLARRPEASADVTPQNRGLHKAIQGNPMETTQPGGPGLLLGLEVRSEMRRPKRGGTLHVHLHQCRSHRH